MGTKPNHPRFLFRPRPPSCAGCGARRRAWLHGALYLFCYAAFPAAPLCVAVHSGRAGAQGAGWSGFGDFAALGGRAALARQGALYLDAHPLERDPAVLTRLLAPESGAPLRESLLAAIARDWRRHDVLAVDGWLLSRSEARICALAFLSAPA